MPTIDQLIEEKRRTQDRITVVITALESVLTTMRLWAKEEGSDGRPRKKILEMAEIVLKESGRPMHVKAMAERVMEKFDFNVKPQSLGTMLWRTVQKKHSRFVKERGSDNTYGLREWEK